MRKNRRLFGRVESAITACALLALTLNGCGGGHGQPPFLTCPSVDISMSIDWNDQQSPNIGTCTGTGTAEQNLVFEIEDVVTSFTPVG